MKKYMAYPEAFTISSRLIWRIIRTISREASLPTIRHDIYETHTLDAENVRVDDILDFHARFEKIHPFYDGNGRVGRLLMQDNMKAIMNYFEIPTQKQPEV